MSAKMTSVTLKGSKDTVRQQLTRFQDLYNADEIMAVSYIFDEDLQKHSYKIFKEVIDGD
jgi:alkanesulfonate monooxygenase SsuD/methylene tetrahydromethanopterin reductase-like flavin-dependent oxidoreductase (luciferase family)